MKQRFHPRFLNEVQERKAVLSNGNVYAVSSAKQRVALEDVLRRRTKEEVLEDFEARTKALFA